MKNKWYRSKVTKSIWVIAELIFTMLMAASILCAITYPSIAEEIVEKRGTNRYEDSYVFDETLQRYSSKAVDGIWVRGLLETDGRYDENKIIDIQEFWDGRTVSGKNNSGLAFRVKNLLEWNVDENAYAYDEIDSRIIVCEREDGTYRYYKYADFARQIASDKLKLNGFIEESADLFDYLQNMGDTGENFLRIQDENGEILFVNCWMYDGTYIKEEYKPIGADSILDIVNEDERWNGRLQDAYDMIYSTVHSFNEYQISYQELEDGLKEGDTNYRFVYVDKSAKKVYSNYGSYSKFKNADQYIEEIKTLGSYVVVEPLLNGFESSIPDADASEWRNTVRYAGNESADFLFAAGVDTEYPIQDSLYKEKQSYETYAAGIKALYIVGIISTVLWIAGFVWLTIVAGKNPDNEEITLGRFDRWKTEIAAILVLVLGLAAGAGGCVLFADNVYSAHYYEYYQLMTTLGGITDSYPVIIAAATGLIAIAFAIFLGGYLSLVRRIKAKTLWKDSVLRMIVSFVKRVVSHIHELWKTLMVFAIVIGIHWLALIFGVAGDEFIAVAMMFIIEILALAYLVVYVIGRDKIEKGIRHIAEGEVDYKITTEKMLPGHKKLAEVVNEIGAGLDAAVEKSMKSERLKTDLITNVSHDIKTPLTSIINYIDLLKKENFQDPKVQHYIEVLEQKAQRLKVLTEDVVEASKVSSGNVTLEYMRINFVEMIQQTSGEFEEKFKKRNLHEILRLPEKEVVIRVDGRRTWRILENIYNNAAKYAMEGSRVYADLKVIDGKARFELKNISEQPLNISADELTERFIRGDVSRSTEGSGLGLSIARSLTEMQGGKFELYLDGDLFKVTVEFSTV